MAVSLQTYMVGARGERIGRIAREVHGTERSGMVERLLDVNPGLALLAPFIPARTVLRLPVRGADLDVVLRAALELTPMAYRIPYLAVMGPNDVDQLAA